MATTIQFNCSHVTGIKSPKIADRHISWVQKQVSQIAFELDRIYNNTKHVKDRVSQNDRFAANCVVEKPNVNPHVHIAWYLSNPRKTLVRPIELLARKCFLLQALNSDGLALSVPDQELLAKWRHKAPSVDTNRLVNWKRRGWSARSESIYSDGWSSYITKEQLKNRDFSDQVFDLKQFHIEGQRCKSTRFFTIDRLSGKQILDLDRPLSPRR